MASHAIPRTALDHSKRQTLHLSITSMLSFVETSPTYPLIHLACPLDESQTPSSNTSTSIDSPGLSTRNIPLHYAPRFVPAYLAEPTGTSSLVIDDFIDSMSSQSVYTLSSAADLADDTDFNIPEMLAEDIVFADAQCNCAEAVRIVFAGPPKVVDLIRADRPRSKRASQIQFRRVQERPFLSPIQPAARASSVSSESSRTSDTSMDRKSTVSSTPSTPVLDNDETPGSPASEKSCPQPETPRMSIETPEHGFASSKDDTQSIMTPPTLKSYMRKPSRLFLPKRTTSATAEALDANKILPITPPQTPGSVVRSSSMFSASRPRLVARGASERQPPIELPPSPTQSERPSIPRRITAAPAIPTSTPSIRSSGRKSISRGLRRMESRMGLNVH